MLNTDIHTSQRVISQTITSQCVLNSENGLFGLCLHFQMIVEPFVLMRFFWSKIMCVCGTWLCAIGSIVTYMILKICSFSYECIVFLFCFDYCCCCCCFWFGCRNLRHECTGFIYSLAYSSNILYLIWLVTKRRHLKMTQLTTTKLCRYGYRQFDRCLLFFVYDCALSALVYMYFCQHSLVLCTLNTHHKRIAVLELVFKHELKHSIIFENNSIPKLHR